MNYALTFRVSVALYAGSFSFMKIMKTKFISHWLRFYYWSILWYDQPCTSHIYPLDRKKIIKKIEKKKEIYIKNITVMTIVW